MRLTIEEYIARKLSMVNKVKAQFRKEFDKLSRSKQKKELKYLRECFGSRFVRDGLGLRLKRK